MKVEKVGVHHKQYDGHYMKQWVKIPKATWTSPILGKRSTCQTPSNKAYLINDDVNDEVPNGTPKTLIPFDGVIKWDGVLKTSNDKLKSDHATHSWTWIKSLLITLSSVWKCSYIDDVVKVSMMWMFSTMDGNKQEGKRLIIERKVLKWTKTNSAPLKGSSCWVPMVDGMTMTSPSQLQWI